MDYVSSFGGAVGSDALHGSRQFEHPLLARALADIALSAHAHGKVAVHSVTLTIGDGEAAGRDAQRAAHDFGYQRKWSPSGAGGADHRAFRPALKRCSRPPASCWRPGSRLGAGPARWPSARPRQLPLLVAGAAAGAPYGGIPAARGGGRLLWRRPEGRKAGRPGKPIAGRGCAMTTTGGVNTVFQPIGTGPDVR